jgi:hypothetical protein
VCKSEDRESDIYELLCLAQQLGTHFLVRTCVDRRAGDGEHTVRDAMKQAPVRGPHCVQVRNKQGEFSTAVLEIRCRRMVVRPPIGKQKDYPELILTAIHASERDTPKDREKIDWKLLTDLHVHASGSCRETCLVRAEMEDRDLPQNPEVRAQGGRSEAENGRATCKPHCDPMHPELENFLDHHAESHTAGSFA